MGGIDTEHKVTDDMVNELYTVISQIKDEKTCKELFDDLCTYKEVLKMAQRLRAAKLLSEGKTYSQVIEETDISSATLSRVSACVQRGKGYMSVFGK